ncbi:hypothetical protein HY642_07290 [Candidatus Woesearchaeota archaeon]|nr:hypothetical protein [Candidatus Woesearchaeota archaeon]
MRFHAAAGILILAAVLASFATVLFHERALLVITLPVDAIVGQRIGLNADIDGLHFGSLGTGMQSTHKMSLNNTWQHAVVVSMRVDGDIAKWTAVPEPVVLLPGESRQVEILLAVPQDAQQGRISGTFVAVFRRG